MLFLQIITAVNKHSFTKIYRIKVLQPSFLYIFLGKCKIGAQV